MKLDQSYLGSTIFLLQIAFIIDHCFKKNPLRWWLAKKKSTARSYPIYPCASVQLGEDYQMITPKVEIWFIWDGEMELWSWFLFTNTHNNRTRRPQAMKMVGFFEGLGILPKICNFFPACWRLVQDTWSLSGCLCQRFRFRMFCSVCSVYIPIRTQITRILDYWPIKWCRSPPQKKRSIGF